MNRKTIGIYIHIPFCVRKCLYCDFVSGPGTDGMKEDYVNQLLKEIEENANKDYLVNTIFIGGGTPSSIGENQIEAILCKLKECFDISNDCECSIEVNPGTVDEQKLKKYHEAGVNRLSIGLQSCNDNELKVLGRIHTYQDFEETYLLARKTGFDNINVDLMSSIPKQNTESFMQSLERVAGLEPEHVSVYSLIVEEGTPFYDMDLELPDEEEERQIYHQTALLLKEYGYEQYEISNYARANKQCKHNIRYWQCEEYLGFGVAAASYLNGKRWKNTASIELYLDSQIKENGDTNIFEEVEYLSEQDQYAEFMIMGLRMNAGISEADFVKRFGVDLKEIYGDVIHKHVANKLLLYEDGTVRLTDLGRDVSNYVMADFMFTD